MSIKTIVRWPLLLLCGFLTGCVNGLFYFPDQVDYSPRLINPIPHEEVWINRPDGGRLHAWFLPAQQPVKGSVLFLHGNAQNLTAHAAYVDWLPAAGYHVLAIDYRGYGLSPGKPNRAGLLADARAAYFYLRGRADVNPNALIIYGQSLGGANALALAGRESLSGLKAVIADSAFSHYGRIVREKMLQIPVLGWLLWPFSPLMVSPGLNPDKTVADIAPVPLLLIHGDQDVIVPSSHSQRLYRLAQEPKTLWLIKGAGHTEALGRFRQQTLPALTAFLDEVLVDTGPKASTP